MKLTEIQQITHLPAEVLTLEKEAVAEVSLVKQSTVDQSCGAWPVVFPMFARKILVSRLERR